MNIQKLMSWKDFAKPEELEEMAAVDREVQEAMRPVLPVKAKQQEVYRKIKIRCDARMRRAKEAE